MELKHIISKDEANSTVTLLLYGVIGGEIDGHYFAQEINYLSERYDEIVIRINSEGGSVMEGLSIFNALLQSKAYTVVRIDGVAASMAGVIPMAANRVEMNDFARIMLHNPFYAGGRKPTKKEEKALDNFREVLVSLISKRFKGDTKAILDAETWFTASEALDAGIIDEIILTGKEKEVTQALVAVANLSEAYKPYLIENKTEMKLIASLFGLEASVAESEIVNSIKALQIENEALKRKEKELNDLANGLKEDLKASRKKEIESIVDGAINAGYFAKEKRDEMIALGEENFEMLQKVVNNLIPVRKSITETIASSQSAGDDTRGEKKDFVWYAKNEPETLAEMRTLEPERYKKLEEEYNKKYC